MEFANTIDGINAVKNGVCLKIRKYVWREVFDCFPVSSGRCRFVAMNEIFPRDGLSWIIYTCTSEY